MVFFFNVSGATEIYTYWHARALHVGHAICAVRGGSGGVGVDVIVRIAEVRGFKGGVMIGFPASAGMPWLVSAQAVKAQDAHVLTIDAGSGAVAQDVDWRMFGGGAKIGRAHA